MRPRTSRSGGRRSVGVFCIKPLFFNGLIGIFRLKCKEDSTMFFSARGKPGWLAIVSQGTTLTLAHVVRLAGSPPQLRMLESFPAEDGVAAAVQRLRAARALKSYRCTTLLDDGEYGVTPLDAPPVPREERREALRWTLKDMVGYPVDSACIEVLDLPAGGLLPGRAAGVLVVSASEAAVRARVAPFEAARIRLDAVDIPELAQRNVAALLEDDNRGLAMLRIDERGTLLTLTFHGELVAVRRGEATAQQLGEGSLEARERVRERLVLELQRSLDSFDRQYSHIPVSKVVLACCPHVDGLTAALAESSYVPVQALDLASVLDVSALSGPCDAQRLAGTLLAIGAALRTDEAAA